MKALGTAAILAACALAYMHYCMGTLTVANGATFVAMVAGGGLLIAIGSRR